VLAILRVSKERAVRKGAKANCRGPGGQVGHRPCRWVVCGGRARRQPGLRDAAPVR